MTQKEIIAEIRDSQKEMDKKQLQMSLDLSIFMNKQDTFNQSVNLILDKLHEREEKNENRISTLEIKNKVFDGKIGVLGLVFGTIGGLIGYVVNLIYNK